VKKAISTELNQSNVGQVMAVLAESPGTLERLTGPISAQRLARPLGPGQRSATEVLAHLLNCEARSSEAIYLALLADEPELLDIHPERHLGKLLRFDLLPVADLVAYFKLRRTVLLRVLAALTAAKWARAIREPGKQRRESVFWRARTIAMHELDHLGELERGLGRAGGSR
jgi:hypothetical protein